jgi:hypothetical protein
VQPAEVAQALDNQQRLRAEEEARQRQAPREQGVGAGHEPARARRARGKQGPGSDASPPATKQRRPRTAAEAAGARKGSDRPAGVKLAESRVAQVRALEGRLLVKVFVSPKTGRQRRYWGRISVVGTGRTSFPLLVTYEDGDSESMELEEAQPLLMPVGTPLPRGVVIPPPGAAARTGERGPAANLPDSWALHTPEGAERALQDLMPGAWAPGTLAALAACARLPPSPVPAGDEQQRSAQARLLGGALQFASVLSALEVFPASGAQPSGAVMALQAAGVKVIRLPWRASPLEARSWRQLAGAPDVAVGAPPALLLDVLLPLALHFVRIAAVFPAPREYITAAPYPRRRWLHGMQGQGRLMLLQDPPAASPGLSELVWIIAFSSKAAQQLMATWPDLALARRRASAAPAIGGGRLRLTAGEAARARSL